MRANRLSAITPRAAIFIASALLGAAILLAFQNDRILKAEKIRQTSVQAEILAASIAAPLAFDDSIAVQEYLAALRKNPDIQAAGAYDDEGRLMGQFSLSGALPPKTGRLNPPSIVDRDLIVTAKVAQGDTSLGSVYLRSSLERWPRRGLRYLGIALLVLMASLLIAVLGSSYASLREAHDKLRAEIRNREKAEEALRQSQKMEAMGQLTGGVAHDFNNLLMVAQSGLDLMDRTSDPAKIEKLKAGIRHAIDRGAKLTQQLLTFARKSPLHPEVVDIGRRLRSMDTLLERSLGENFSVDYRIAPQLWPVEVDPSQLEVALLNIVLNARDAMPGGGRIIISVENETGRDGDRVRISVADTGSGIAPELLSNIFDPFFTTKGVGKGTGLGLSQVYGFTRSSGGDVQVESEPGKGATISLLLPRTLKAPPESELVQRRDVAGHRNGRILLVEDDDQVAAMIREMLAALGYDSERAISGDAAVDLLNTDENFDLVISDMVMPGRRSGLDLVQEIGERWPALPTMLMTGYSDAAIAAARENISVLRKPYTIERLSAEIQATLRLRED